MFDSLSTEIKFLFAKIEAKISFDVSDTFKTTISPNSSRSSTQSTVAPVSTKMLPTVTLVQVDNEEMTLLISVKDMVRVTNSTYSMEFSIFKVVKRNFSLNLLCPNTNQFKILLKNQIYRVKEKKEGCTFAFT
ncbi:unnamed protein product [Hymenolepis diminuta]|uniref:Uncharacterized protein n=1 Tax=Hymenolepis diminuta TaxID=6216 RepID=A0A564Y9M6_HYMDI|nr:unnamed protein product [Hymenolepis diminuta]